MELQVIMCIYIIKSLQLHDHVVSLESLNCYSSWFQISLASTAAHSTLITLYITEKEVHASKCFLVIHLHQGGCVDWAVQLVEKKVV